MRVSRNLEGLLLRGAEFARRSVRAADLDGNGRLGPEEIGRLPRVLREMCRTGPGELVDPACVEVEALWGRHLQALRERGPKDEPVYRLAFDGPGNVAGVAIDPPSLQAAPSFVQDWLYATLLEQHGSVRQDTHAVVWRKHQEDYRRIPSTRSPSEGFATAQAALMQSRHPQGLRALAAASLGANIDEMSVTEKVMAWCFRGGMRLLPAKAEDTYELVFESQQLKSLGVDCLELTVPIHSENQEVGFLRRDLPGETVACVSTSRASAP